jgi:hypothetical protein
MSKKPQDIIEQGFYPKSFEYRLAIRTGTHARGKRQKGEYIISF